MSKRDYTPIFCFDCMLEDTETRAKEMGLTISEFAQNGKKANSKLAKTILKEMSESDNVDYIEDLIGEYNDARTNQHLLKRFYELLLYKDIIDSLEDYKKNKDHSEALHASTFFDCTMDFLSEKQMGKIYDIIYYFESFNVFEGDEPVVLTPGHLDKMIADFKGLLN